MSDQKDTDLTLEKSFVAYLREGISHIGNIPSLILIMAFVGFGGLARDAGLSVWEAMFITASTWALPSAVLVVGAISSNAPFIATAFAVMLASVRLMPMVMALVPVMRGKKSSTALLVFSSTFVAITAWVFAMLRLPTVPREGRLPFFLGFAASLTVINIAVTGLSHQLMGALPNLLAAALLLLTPLYFLISTSAASRYRFEKLALGFGLLLGPVFKQLTPGTELLWAGLLGGTLAYLATKLPFFAVEKGE